MENEEEADVEYKIAKKYVRKGKAKKSKRAKKGKKAKKGKRAMKSVRRYRHKSGARRNLPGINIRISIGAPYGNLRRSV